MSENGDLVVAGDPMATGMFPATGAAFVFAKPLAGWTNAATHNAKLFSSGSSPFSRFGRSVALSGDQQTIVVGAPEQDCPTNCGATFTFKRPGATWTGDIEPSGRLDTNPTNRIARFGSSVAISDDGRTLAVGGCWGLAQVCDAVAVYTTTTTFITSTQAALLRFQATQRGAGSRLAMTGDARQIVVGSRELAQVLLFDMPVGGWSGSVINSLPTSTGLPPVPVTTQPVPFAMSRDGSTMVVGYWAGGTFGEGLAFVLGQPTFADFNPKSGMPGDTITVTGTGLDAVSGVTFGGTAANARRLVSLTTMTATVGTGASGSVGLAVGGSSILLPGFTFIKGPSSVSLTSHTPDVSVPGEPVAVKFNVSTALGVPAGTVTVTATTGEKCVATASAGECTITFYTTGNRSLTATYGGTSAFLPSTSAPLSHDTLLQTITIISNVSSTNPDPLTPVTVQFSVNAIGIATAPVGTVKVTATTGETCTATVAAGQCVLFFQTSGPRILTAAYSGAPGLSPSTSNAVALGVTMRHFIFLVGRN